MNSDMYLKLVGQILPLILLSFHCLIAQENLDQLVKKGVGYHDEGNYDEAISTYKEALKIDAGSPLVNYELSLSYMSKGDYKNTIKYADAVLKNNGNYLVEAYNNKGSALDMLGKTKKSIKVFKEGIEHTGGNYLLYFNLGVNYYKLQELEEAEENFLEAVNENPNHASSHLLLADLHHRRGDKVQTILSTYYFLFLEPDTKRSVHGNQMLSQGLVGNVSQDASKPNTINISLSPNVDSDFGATELMISAMAAQRSVESEEERSEDQIFLEQTRQLFNMLAELNTQEKDGIVWKFYVPFYDALAKSNHLSTFCHYIRQAVSPGSQQWLSEHEKELADFDKWLQNR